MRPARIKLEPEPTYSGGLFPHRAMAALPALLQLGLPAQQRGSAAADPGSSWQRTRRTAAALGVAGAALRLLAMARARVPCCGEGSVQGALQGAWPTCVYHFRKGFRWSQGSLEWGLIKARRGVMRMCCLIK